MMHERYCRTTTQPVCHKMNRWEAIVIITSLLTQFVLKQKKNSTILTCRSNYYLNTVQTISIFITLYCMLVCEVRKYWRGIGLRMTDTQCEFWIYFLQNKQDRITLLTTTYRTELNILQQSLNAKYFSFEIICIFCFHLVLDDCTTSLHQGFGHSTWNKMTQYTIVNWPLPRKKTTFEQSNIPWESTAHTSYKYEWNFRHSDTSVVNNVPITSG